MLPIGATAVFGARFRVALVPSGGFLFGGDLALNCGGEMFQEFLVLVVRVIFDFNHFRR